MENKQLNLSEPENIMGTMDVNPLLIKLSIPMMISMLVQALYNVVDSIFVARVSENALTAVSLAFSLQNMMFAVGIGTGVGVNALLSKSLGEKNQYRANKTAENGLFLALCSYLVFLVLGLTVVRPYFYAQTAMYEIMLDLVVMIAPVLSFTMEEVWQFMKKPASLPESVFMMPWPECKEEYIDEALETKWDNFIEIRSEITKVLEGARRAKTIGHSLDAKVELHATGEALAILKSVESDLATLLIVSQAQLAEGLDGGVEATGREDLKVTVQAAEGEKCERCWIYSDTVGKDAEHPTLCARCAAALK